MNTMTEEELWEVFSAKNPDVLDGDSQLTPKGIRQIFHIVYTKAHEAGYEAGYNDARPPVDSSFFDEFLRGMAPRSNG